MVYRMTVTTSPEGIGFEAGVISNIRAEMARRNVSNVEMARHLGFSTNAFWRRMSGATSWNLTELGAVAERLGVQVDDLLAVGA